MALHFGKMEVEGFGPILDSGFNWGIKGLNIVKADNGSGKSKFINALVWGLYGKTLSGSVETWDSIKTKKHQGTKVSIEFTKNGYPYKVIRCKGYKGKVNGVTGKNRLILEEDGEEVELDGKADSQKELENILGYSYNLFKNSIIFGQKLKRLVSESGPNKKALLDEAFEVSYIAKANKLASDVLKEIGSKLSGLNHSKDLLSLEVLNIEKLISNEEEIERNFIRDKLIEIRLEREKIAKLKSERVELESSILSIPGKREELKNLTIELKALEDERKALDKKDPKVKLARKGYELSLKEKEALKCLKSIESIKKSILSPLTYCVACGRDYEKSHKDKHLKDLKDSLKVEEENYQLLIDNISILKKGIKKSNLALSSLTKVEELIKSINKKIKILETTINNSQLVSNNIENISGKILDCRYNIKVIKGKTFQKNYEGYARTLSEKKEELANLAKQINDLETDYNDNQWLIKEPLSNSGLKAFIFDRMLDSINLRLEYYSKFSGVSVGFIIDMDSAKKDLNTLISNPQGEYVPYEDLSGGQQQKVDIVTVFAIHDVISDTKNCDLLVMDELFESLDVNNIEMLTELIQDKAKNKCLYLITHRGEFSPTNSNTIEVLFNDGVTSIE